MPDINPQAPNPNGESDYAATIQHRDALTQTRSLINDVVAAYRRRQGRR